MRGQSGFEFIVLFSALIFALLLVSYTFYTNFQGQSRVFQARIAVDKIGNAVDSVASQGVGSSKLVSVYFPSGLLAAKATSRAVVLTVASADGKPTEVVAVTLVNISQAQLPTAEGKYVFIVTFNSTGNVSISI